jgi:two-component system sensor histidine kinase PilS (NtrC family)
MARVVVAALLLAYVPALHGMRAGLGGFDGPRFMVVAGAYLAVAALLVVLSRPGRLPLQRLVDWQLAADVVALTMLLDAAGPLRAGLAMLLLLPNAGAAILLDARRALFFASMSTFALLIVTGWHWMRGDADDASMAQAGMMGAALMACVLLLNWLATRLDRQERLAAQRGEDVRNQLAVTQAVISELPDGVVVLSATGGVRAINPSAREMLGRRVAAPEDATTGIALLRQALTKAAPGALSAQGIELTVPGGVGVSARRLRARRLPGSDESTDAVIVLEDLGRLEQRAQEL